MRNNLYSCYDIYTTVFDYMLKMRINQLTVPLEDICERMGIELIPLSTLLRSGLWTEANIYKIWRNENGHLFTHKNKFGWYEFKIAFNDNDNHKERSRFTIAEELSHVILGHYKHEMYKYDNYEYWDNDLYQTHEESARIAAGFLVCAPPVFYEVPSLNNVEDIKYLCDISKGYARTRFNVLSRYRLNIENHHLYNRLVTQYEEYIENLPCPCCGGMLIQRNDGICRYCAYELGGFEYIM